MDHPAAPQDDHGHRLRTIAWIALGVAVAYLVWWGIRRGLETSFDLTVGFSAGQAWLHGRNPYDSAILTDVFASSGGGTDAAQQLDTLLNVYFPTTLPLFVPSGIVDWSEAKLLMLVVNTVASAFVALGLCRVLEWRFSEPRSVLFVAFVLALAPLHTSIAIGQSAIIATGLIVAAIILDRSGRPVASGIAYGLATAAKVQLGLPFLAYQFWRRRWTSAGTGSLVLAALTLMAVIRMEVATVPWLTSWSTNLQRLSGAGGFNDASPLNPERYSLVNLQYLIGSFGISDDVADVVTYLLVGLAALLFVTLLRVRPPSDKLLAPAVIATLSLLVTYHRYYDAVILALPIAWAMMVWQTGQRRLAVVALVLCADFILPVQTALHDFEQRQVLPSAVTDGFLWQSVLMTQHVWALVILAAVLLLAAAGAGRSGREPIGLLADRVPAD